MSRDKKSLEITVTVRIACPDLGELTDYQEEYIDVTTEDIVAALNTTENVVFPTS